MSVTTGMVTANLAVETRENSVIIRGSYPWSQNSPIGVRSEFVEVPHDDLPALVLELIEIMRAQNPASLMNISNAYASGRAT